MSFFIVPRRVKMEFPHFSRIFTATPVFFVIVGFFVTGILVFGPWRGSIQRNTVLGADTTKQTDMEASYEALKTRISSHPDWPSGNLNLAIFAYQLGRFSEARVYIERTLFLDPNNSKAIELKKTMESETAKALLYH